MAEAAFYVAAVALALMTAACGFLVVRSSSVATRILALDTTVLLLLGLLVVFSYWQGVPYYLDAALVLALLGFIGTLGAARFYREGRLF